MVMFGIVLGSIVDKSANAAAESIVRIDYESESIKSRGCVDTGGANIFASIFDIPKIEISACSLSSSGMES
jgi:hypothetical protein